MTLFLAHGPLVCSGCNSSSSSCAGSAAPAFRSMALLLLPGCRPNANKRRAPAGTLASACAHRPEPVAATAGIPCIVEQLGTTRVDPELRGLPEAASCCWPAVRDGPWRLAAIRHRAGGAVCALVPRRPQQPMCLSGPSSPRGPGRPLEP